MHRSILIPCAVLWSVVAVAAGAPDESTSQTQSVRQCASLEREQARVECVNALVHPFRSGDDGTEVKAGALEGCSSLESPRDRLVCYETTLGKHESVPPDDASGAHVAASNAVSGSPAVAVSADALRSCAALRRRHARLDCYDAVVDDGAVGNRVDGTAQAGNGSADGNVEAADAPDLASPLARRWELVAQADRGPFVITPYKPTYVLPLSYNFSPNEAPFAAAGRRDRDIDEAEIEFQISFKAKVWPDVLGSHGDLWFGYTQKSFWQGYSSSSPFRETNYEPEVIYGYRTHFDVLGLHNRLLTFGINHQSNGRGEPLSRSWNRITAGALLDYGNFALRPRVWWRIPESANEDDNPDIVDYLGHGEVWGFYQKADQRFALMLRSAFDDGDVRGAVQLDYSFALEGPVRGYVKLFHGYGDSLIDYNHETSRVGIGVMLTDWF